MSGVASFAYTANAPMRTRNDDMNSMVSSSNILEHLLSHVVCGEAHKCQCVRYHYRHRECYWVEHGLPSYLFYYRIPPVISVIVVSKTK